MRTRQWRISAIMVCALLLASIAVRAVDDPKPDSTKPEAPARPQRPNRGGPQAPGGRGGIAPAMMMQRDAVADAVAALGELNLMPDFSLTKEQKEKIQAIRTTAKTAHDKWMADHKEDLQKLMDEARAAGGPNGDREKMRQIRTARQELMATAPKADDAIKELKAVLAEDQAKKLDEQIAKMAEARRQNFGGGIGGPGGLGGAPNGRRPRAQ